MDLFRVYAYAVEPQRTTESTTTPDGGSVTVTQEIQTALENASRSSRLETRTPVDFNVDPNTRSSEVRNLLLQFSFGTGPEARAAAVRLATRLSGSMDHRSTPCLFILASEREGQERRTTLWTFPRDEAFQFRGGRDTAAITLLTDIFSRTSKLRKAALFEGRSRRTDFLRGRVLDYQAATRAAADFWISRFLDAVFAIRGEAGTRLLAQSLRKAYDAAEDISVKQDLYAAIVSVRRAPRRRWSMQDFADNYLEGQARSLFLDCTPNEETLNSNFDFDRDTFDNTLNFRVFRLDSDVWISAPFNQIGRAVRLSGRNNQHLSCEGEIEEDFVRTRYA